MSKKKKNQWKKIVSLIIVICITLVGAYIEYNEYMSQLEEQNKAQSEVKIETIDISQIPEYTTEAYVKINNNVPSFKDEEYTTDAFEKYSDLDALGRAGVAYANVCKETMPKKNEQRGEISSVNNLTGWVQKRYDNIIKDKYLYNRCHLIGWQLSAENANRNNLITGTRYFNTEGMLPFENEVADYIKQNQKNHVLYRVTPIYDGNNLLASGVQMEASSVEDKGQGVSFNIYCYNVQPGIEIDYATGESKVAQK